METPSPESRTPVSRIAFGMFSLCQICFGLTVIATWPLWQNRETPPNLPMIEGISGIPFGFILLAVIAFSLWKPRIGFLIQVAVVALSIVFDLIRCQPQVFAMPVLMASCLFPSFRKIGFWFLVAMWGWAGVHKLLSPYWLGPSSWVLLTKMGFESAENFYLPFALLVALSEIGIAGVAIWRPKWAAFYCLGLHLGIAAMLLLMQWNFSVLYWNIATAIVGAWLLLRLSESNEEDLSGRNSSAGSGPMWTQFFSSVASLWPRIGWQRLAVVILIVSPAGVYQGWTPHFLAHVLYSDHLPRATITNKDGGAAVSTWETLHVPVPRVRAILRYYFRQAGSSGDKLHLLDSRAALDDGYYTLSEGGKVQRISKSDFFARTKSGFRGVARDYAPAVFQLHLAGVDMRKKTEKGEIFAVQFAPENYSGQLLGFVKHFPNVQQVQLSGCAVKDDDLAALVDLQRLLGVGLDDTPVTDDCLRSLARIKNLQVVEYADTALTDSQIESVLGK